MIDSRTAHVVGMGEVGGRLAAALAAGGVQVTPVTRTSGWDTVGRGDGDVLVCVREDDLEALLPRLADVEPERLVFVQNGWVRPLLDEIRGCSRGLIWFTSKGGFYRHLRPSPFHGPRAAELVEALQRGGLPAEAMDDRSFRAADVDKMGFNCVVGLPLAVHGMSLGSYLDERRDEASRVFAEAVDVLSAAVGIEPDPEMWGAFVESVAPITWMKPSQAKALAFRNGAVVREARRLGLDAPANADLLRRYGVEE